MRNATAMAVYDPAETASNQVGIAANIEESTTI
jgi:hypothetical protein